VFACRERRPAEREREEEEEEDDDATTANVFKKKAGSITPPQTLLSVSTTPIRCPRPSITR
jgi:hypothetical protein